jgi:hypothetical protein
MRSKPSHEQNAQRLIERSPSHWRTFSIEENPNVKLSRAVTVDGMLICVNDGQ